MAGDYIRRDFALAGTELYKYGEMEIEAVCAEHIQRLPAADVAPVVHGEWLQIRRLRQQVVRRYGLSANKRWVLAEGNGFLQLRCAEGGDEHG